VSSDGTWYDEEAGAIVRPYAMTRGRTSSRQSDLEMITLVVSAGPVTRAVAVSLEPESLQILDLCGEPKSVAELAAELRLPLSVVKILLGDLIERNLVMFRSAVTPNLQVLQAVINGIRRL